MEIQEKFLPIGTVVLLKGGKKELMIMSYCIIPAGEVYDKDGKVDVGDAMFDYGGCVYPEGMITSDQLFAFNHDQIEKVVYMGYETDQQKEISKVLNGGMKEREKRLAEQKAGVSKPVIPTADIDPLKKEEE
ncbi:MAG: DUF4176 domain-containing protein [Bacilli bacterium]|nr:DUF4176 domain-containing protein [Bacilli bacterium]